MRRVATFAACARRIGGGELDLTSGNATLMRKVRDGQLAWGWTDTDDFNVARDAGAAVAVVYPDQAQSGDGADGARTPVGTMMIPNTVAIIRGAPHLDAAKQLVDFILAPYVEEQLAASRSAQIPVRASVPRPERVVGFDDIAVMAVDFSVVGREIPMRHEEFKEMFLD